MAVGFKVKFYWYQIGDSDFLHSFFSTVAYNLENGNWGSRFPVIMNELYQGKLECDNTDKALEELSIIRKELQKFSPEKVVWDIEDLSKQPPWGNDISEDITDLSVTERANKGISFAFQQPVRFKGLTVRDLITLAKGEKISVAEACSYLSEVGLCAKDYINREVNASLSGGELKRIEIAMIIARGTKLSLFDEPEAGIDLWSFNNLIKVFEGMHEKINGSILIISHQERILNIADKIIVISDGQVAAQGTKQEVLPKLLASSEACETLMNKLV